MALQDVAHRLIADGIAQVRQGADDAIITPRAICLRHADDQCFQLLVDLWASWSLPMLGALKFPSDQLPVPRQDRIGCDDRGDLCQRLLAQLLANGLQGFPFAIAQPHAALYLVAEDTVLRHQRLVPEEEVLVH